jgi:hypothetical protein
MHTRQPAVVVSPSNSSIIFSVCTLWFRRYSLVTLLVGAVGLPSCSLVFSERDAGSSSDGPISDGLVVDSQDRSRLSKSFTAPVGTGVTGGDPSLTSDETELWSVGGNPYDLQVAKPTGATPPWSYDPTAVTLLNDPLGLNDIEPALTKDGLLLAFVSSRAGPDQLYFATRNATTLSFKNPTANSIALPNSFLGFDMSPDGLKIYFVDGVKLNVMSRPSLTAAFSLANVIVLPDANARYPSVSFDELEILYSNLTGQVIHATLAANGNTYENPTVLAVGEPCNTVFEDADLSADAMTVVYNCNGSIHIARRQ